MHALTHTLTYLCCDVTDVFGLGYYVIGADLPGAVGADVPIGKGSMGACTRKKNCHVYKYRKIQTLWSIDSRENE